MLRLTIQFLEVTKMTEQRMNEIGDRVAEKHGLSDEQKLSMWRCTAALNIFNEGHPEHREVVGLLKADDQLLDATIELVNALNM